jgi:hypothetical protein
MRGGKAAAVPRWEKPRTGGYQSHPSLTGTNQVEKSRRQYRDYNLQNTSRKKV